LNGGQAVERTLQFDNEERKKKKKKKKKKTEQWQDQRKTKWAPEWVLTER